MAAKKRFTHSFQRLGHSRRYLQDWKPFLLYFLTAFPSLFCLSTLERQWETSLSGSIKEPDIQTQRRWLLWQISLPSWSTGFPNKVIFLASTLPLGLFGLSCGKQSKLGFNNKLGHHTFRKVFPVLLTHFWISPPEALKGTPDLHLCSSIF